MITELSIYWITRLDGIRSLVENFASLLIVATILVGCATIIVSLIEMCAKHDSIIFRGHERYTEDLDYSNAHAIRLRLTSVLFKCVLPLAILTTVATVFIPTTKEYCAIKVVPAIVNNVKAQELTNELYNLGVEWLKELKPAKAAAVNAADASTQN